MEEVKKAAAERWASAVNADGTFGRWRYAIVKKPSEVPGVLDAARAGDGPAGGD